MYFYFANGYHYIEQSEKYGLFIREREYHNSCSITEFARKFDEENMIAHFVLHDFIPDPHEKNFRITIKRHDDGTINGIIVTPGKAYVTIPFRFGNALHYNEIINSEGITVGVIATTMLEKMQAYKNHKPEASFHEMMKHIITISSVYIDKKITIEFSPKAQIKKNKEIFLESIRNQYKFEKFINIDNHGMIEIYNQYHVELNYDFNPQWDTLYAYKFENNFIESIMKGTKLEVNCSSLKSAYILYKYLIMFKSEKSRRKRREIIDMIDRILEFRYDSWKELRADIMGLYPIGDEE